MKKRPLIIAGAVVLIVVLLFVFFGRRGKEEYSCTKKDGKEFSLILKKEKDSVWAKIEDKKESAEISCERVQGEENTYKCYVESRKEKDAEVRSYLLLEEKNEALTLYSAFELGMATEIPDFTDYLKTFCTLGGGRILDNTLCVIPEPFATCKKK